MSVKGQITSPALIPCFLCVLRGGPITHHEWITWHWGKDAEFKSYTGWVILGNYLRFSGSSCSHLLNGWVRFGGSSLICTVHIIYQTDTLQQKSERGTGTNSANTLKHCLRYEFSVGNGEEVTRLWEMAASCVKGKASSHESTREQ